MLLNKVLFVSLLVLGLFYLQPAQCGSRLNTRLAGGLQALPNQFPFVALITYLYTDTSGVNVTYQGTGVIYNPDVVVTSGNALQRLKDGYTLSVSQGVTDLNNPTTADVVQFVASITGASPNVFFRTGFAAGTYFNDVAYIQLPRSFVASGVSLRLPTSSPTAADINKLWVVGYGESFPGAQPSPQLLYIPINPMRNHLCDQALSSKIPNQYSFAENFCLKGQLNDNRTGGTTDVCTLDAGAPVIRTINITSPLNDFEVVGIVNFGTCTSAIPAVASYLWLFAPATNGSFLPAQTAAPAAGSPANPRAFDGNFACGDGTASPNTLEKCDPGQGNQDDITDCCDGWTCQWTAGGQSCGTNNGTHCKTQPICNGTGKCKSKNKTNKKNCAGRGTRCISGKCCTPATGVCV